MLELKATRDGLAAGVVIESSMEKGRGAVATVLVKRGMLKPGDPIIAGQEFGRVRAMFDENGQPVTEAGPSLPVVVLGLSGAPNAGDELLVVESERKAREVALYRQGKFRDTKLAKQGPTKLEDMLSQMGDGKAATVQVVIKADVQGSAEALRDCAVEAVDRRGRGQGRRRAASAASPSPTSRWRRLRTPASSASTCAPTARRAR